MKKITIAMLIALAPALAHAGLDDLKGKLQHQAEGKARAKGNEKIAAQMNKKLLAESRKNQCSFKSGSDQLAPGCDSKAKKLANAMISVKDSLQKQGYGGFKFVVSGHTDSSGNAAKNKELSQRRAEVMVKQLIAKGVNADDIEAVGMGSERPRVKPDNTPKKKAMNRRYEVEVKF